MRNRLQNIQQRKTSNFKSFYKPISYPDIPLSADDIYIKTSIGDRLDSLADQFYDDTRLWWIITTANKDIIERDSFGLKSGLEIRIPGNVSSILNLFEQINK